MFDTIQLQPFKESAEGSAGVRWKKWLKQFELYLQVKNIDDPEIKKTHLLYFGKDDVQKVLEQEEANNDYVSDAYQKSIRKLNAYYLPKVSRIYERSIFRKLEREANEKIESFVLRLKKQADFCDYGDQLEWMIVDQIVEKMHENELKKKILKGNFSLEEIQSMITSHEMVQQQVKAFESEDMSGSVNAIENHKRQREMECFSCGNKGHRSKSSECPALNKQCGICRKIGHFAHKCYKRFKANEEPTNKSNWNRHDRFNQRKTSFIRNITSESIHNNNMNEPDEIIFNLNAGTEVDCFVGGIAMRMIVDTGSTANIIGENDWKNFQNKFSIQQQLIGTDKSFKAYGSKDFLQVIGRIKMKLEIDGKVDDVWFYIIKNGQRSLLSGETAEKMKLIRMTTDKSFPKLRGI